MKNAGNSWMRKKIRRPHDIIYQHGNSAKKKLVSQSNIYDGGFPQKYLTVKSH